LYRSCFTQQTLRERLCFACPEFNDFGLLPDSLKLVADATGANVVFSALRLRERQLPWAPDDIAWVVLWMLPVWTLFLVPALLLARWLLRPRDTVRKELAAALDRVEEEDVRKRFAEQDVRSAQPVCLPQANQPVDFSPGLFVFRKRSSPFVFRTRMSPLLFRPRTSPFVFGQRTSPCVPQANSPFCSPQANSTVCYFVSE
jgi:hypothetical protein